MRRWAGVLAIVVAAVVASPASAAETAAAGPDAARHEAKIANIRKLVHITSGKQIKEMMDKTFDTAFETVEAGVPQEAKEDPEVKAAVQEFLKSAFSEKDIDEQLDLMIPYFDKYLDDADVAELVRFYEGPTGKKAIRVMPEMMAELMPAIMSWQYERIKGPLKTFKKKLEAIQERKGKEPPAIGPNGG